MPKQIYVRKNGSRAVRYISELPSRTKPNFKDDCDIKYILQRFIKDGVLNATVREPLPPGDYSDAPRDYQAALNMVIDTQRRFEDLPAPLRDRFDNDPHVFLEFVSDPKNVDEMYDLGLLVKPIVPAPVDVRVIPEPKDPEVK